MGSERDPVRGLLNKNAVIHETVCVELSPKERSQYNTNSYWGDAH